ncbi:MAG: HAD hydrolase-like protein [Flavobacteriaceae bacterium]|nr:HAD hydrolase-like protein [Bacteroidia bacterium]MBT8288823.1 HAD hydrolase-like protein [Bacteroidia bacterium]NNF76199.1 HAD hydrolase-like protein [Flavobacteriaceae bacterium]NNK72903.1 HAD hydrolase-like protein [Flavobacteriaceae bacterium]
MPEIELPYNALKEEVFKRLQNNLLIDSSQHNRFMEYFEHADLRSEQSVQFLNKDILDLLNAIKSSGIKIYLVSDFYASESIFKSLLKHHGIDNLVDGIYSSASCQKSKKRGQIFEHILSDLKVEAKHVVMMGDDKLSDLEMPRSKGIHSTLLPHKKFRLQNKIKSFGNDKKDYSRTIDKTVRACQQSSAQPLSEYIVFYQVFIERLYIIGRRFKISNFFFVSREGHYLKKLFDAYQDHNFLKESDKIGSHYLRMSRQAAFQVTFKPLHKESFLYFRKRFKNLSLNKFLSNFAFSKDTVDSIVNNFGAIDGDETVEDFFNSSVFKRLKEQPEFIEAYNLNRKQQRKAFLNYLSSFNVDVDKEGINVVDIGWGGTMQEAIFKVFEERIPVTGYYLGLRETYNIQEMTKRYGLLFSIHPYEVYSDHIMMANTQLYEQLLSANHGSTLGYDDSLKNFALENYNEREKALFDDFIRPHQAFMFERFKILLNDLDLICYDYNIVQNKITDLAMRNGLFINARKLKFIASLNKGFYQNVGDKKVGMDYDVSQLGSLRQFIKDFLIQPESKFRFLVKLKPVLHEKRPLLAKLLPMWLVYWFFLFNRYIREKILKRRFFLKYNYFR